MSEKLQARLDAFAYHSPSPGVQAQMTELRRVYRRLVQHLDLYVPECREKSLAFTALEESAMWAMKALSLTDPVGVVVDPPQEEAQERV